eukprot:TRINITY_DN3079_c0_g1_i1.p1 TRINITY_DN3079_c0_g1~~TRINITY_DN3079_c0_g1_i1.p1  ORF type:complete len:100 (-),score=24.37 TRINITY_DN3079_c0_g1_i1:152-412(-)
MSSHSPGSAEVISGMRADCDLVIYVDVAAAMAAGIKFFVSDNQVILSEGDEGGFIPSRFFSRVMSIVRAPNGAKILEPFPHFASMN